MFKYLKDNKLKHLEKIPEDYINTIIKGSKIKIPFTDKTVLNYIINNIIK
jgi:hypothetical protein